MRQVCLGSVLQGNLAWLRAILVLGAVLFTLHYPAHAATCFAVDDDSGHIVVFNRDPPATIRYAAPIIDPQTGSTLAAELIESAYFDSVQNRYYVVVQKALNQFGYIDPFNGDFIPVSLNMGFTATPTAVQVGAGNGATGIRGLTRNPVSNRWYVIDQSGLLFEINPSTGTFVPGAFNGVDYIRVTGPTGTTYTNIEDLAFDASGELFVVRNDVGAEQLLRNVSLITGRAAATANIGIDETEGLALTDGSMRVIIGQNGAAGQRRNFYQLNTTTGATSLIFNLPSPTGTPADYEAQGCNDSAPRADLAVTKTVTPAAVAPGGTFTYTIVLVNQGIDPAYRIQVRDVLDTGMSFVSSTIGVSCTVCSFDNASGIWTVDAIDIGQRRTLTLVVSTSGVAPNTYVNNRAQVVQSCDSAAGACVALADFDSTPDNKSGSWTPTEDDEAIAGALVTTVPSVAKAFLPTSGLAGQTATLQLTLSNPNSASSATLTSAFIDTYPSGMVNGPVPAGATSCGSGVVTAAAGGASVTLGSGAVIPANGSCTVTVVVTAPTVGAYTNTVAPGALTVNLVVTGVPVVATNLVGSTAQYQVTPANVNVIKDFTPDGVSPSATSTLKITFSNPTSVAGTFSSGFTDTYPAGLVNYSTPNAQTSCPGTGAPTAVAGGGSVSLPGTRAVPALGSCTLTVVVTASTKAAYTNTIPTGSVTTSVGSNLGTTSAVLIVDAPSVSKSFSPAAIATGATSTLVITFFNPLSSVATITQTFTDFYPAGIINYTTPAATDTCAGGGPTATAGRGTLTMPVGIQIPALSTCQVSVVVRGTPSASLTGTFVNTVPAGGLTTTLGSNTLAAEATLTISNLADLRVTKVGSPLNGTATTTISYTVTIANLGPGNVTNATFSDTFEGLTLLAPITVTWVGAGAGATNSATSIVTSSTSINANVNLLQSTGDRYVQIVIRALPSIYSGYITNTAAINPPAGTTDSVLANNTASIATLITPTANLQVAKTNNVTSQTAGATSSYTLTFTNLGLSPADGAVIRDTPGAGLACTSVSCSTTGGALCGTVSVGALAAGHPVPSFPAGSTVSVVLTCGVTATGF